MIYSNNKDFNKYIKSLIKSGAWVYSKNGKSKHSYLQHKTNGARCPVPFSPKGDKSALLNFQNQIKRLEGKHGS